MDQDKKIRLLLSSVLNMDEENTIDLHKIDVNLGCDLCLEPLADRLALVGRDTLAYHETCLEDKR